MMETKQLTQELLIEKLPDVMMWKGACTDADTVRTIGMYSTYSTTQNIPPGFGNGVLEVMKRNPKEFFQRVTAWNALKVAERTGSDSGWLSWKIYEPTGTA